MVTIVRNKKNWKKKQDGDMGKRDPTVLYSDKIPTFKLFSLLPLPGGKMLSTLIFTTQCWTYYQIYLICFYQNFSTTC